LLVNDGILGMQSHQKLGILTFGQQRFSGCMATTYLPPDQAQKGAAWLSNVSQFLTPIQRIITEIQMAVIFCLGTFLGSQYHFHELFFAGIFLGRNSWAQRPGCARLIVDVLVVLRRMSFSSHSNELQLKFKWK
jgi:hypothetical protein